MRAEMAQLQQTAEELRTFACSLAHDLRGPLAAIDGFCRELARRLEAQEDELSKHYLERVRANVRSMAELTEAMLSLARASDIPLLHQPVDLSVLARNWVSAAREREPTRDVEFRLQATPLVHGDLRLLADLVDNLLGNAWKFTARRAAALIEFGAEEDADGRTVFFVRDNGAGFDPAYAAKLFVPFQRLHSNAEFPGTGIGLATARKIVQRHGGRIWADGATGKGARFDFTMGCREAPPELRPVPAQG